MITPQVIARLEAVQKDYEISLGMPSDDVIKKIAREQKPELKSNQIEALKRTIIGILASKGDGQDLDKKLGPYSVSSKSFQRIEKYLRFLRLEVSRNTERIEYFIGNDLRKSLGHLVAWSSVSQLEGAMGQLYLDIIDALYLPIKKQVDLNKSNKGGRPSIWTRDLVIEMLARNSDAIIGRRATSTPKGAFERLCVSVLQALGHSAATEGLEEALKRKFEKSSRRK